MEYWWLKILLWIIYGFFYIVELCIFFHCSFVVLEGLCSGYFWHLVMCWLCCPTNFVFLVVVSSGWRYILWEFFISWIFNFKVPIRVYWECGGFDGLLYEALGLELFFFHCFVIYGARSPPYVLCVGWGRGMEVRHMFVRPIHLLSLWWFVIFVCFCPFFKSEGSGFLY